MPDSKPNILLIILDTLRRDHLSAYGYGRETSPEFDAFASEATRFERAVAPAQWTIPAHASIFTGLYPGEHHVVQGNGRLAGEHRTLAELLRGAGYETVAFCNNPLVGILNNGLQRGFEQFYNYGGTAPNRPVDLTRHRARRFLSRRWRRFARRVENQFANSDTMFRLSMHPPLVPIWTRFINFKGHTQRSVDDLIDYWGRHTQGGAEKPLFVFLNLMGAHLPYKPPQDCIDRTMRALRHDRRAYAFMRSFNADAARWASPLDEPLADWQRRALDAFYDAEILHQDYHLGRLLAHLRQSGQLDNTLVIITADHGESHGDHDFFGHGFVVYQELVHVPLLLHGPNCFPAGARITTNVSMRRIFHTVLDVAGVCHATRQPQRDDPVANLSLAGAVNGVPDAEGDVAFVEAYPPDTFLHVIEHRNPAQIERLRLRLVRRGVYDGEHKLAMAGNRVEGLFNVSADPEETRDVARENPLRVSSLQRRLDAFVAAAQQKDAGAEQANDVSEEVVAQLRSLGYLD